MRAGGAAQASYWSRMARMQVVKAKMTAAVTVMRSRLRSTTVEPAAAAPAPPPNMSDSPPPRPLCRRMSRINASDTVTVRSVFIIGPDKKIKLIITYPQSAGRNVDELLRVIDSLQLTAGYSVSTPVDWKDGEDVIIVPAVSDDEAKQKFPGGWKAPRPYLRIVPQPK